MLQWQEYTLNFWDLQGYFFLSIFMLIRGLKFFIEYGQRKQQSYGV